MSNFDVSNYIIQLQSVFIVPEIGSAYYLFLKKEYNTETWDFILEFQTLEKLIKKKNHKRIFLQVNSMVKTFIQEKSPKELSIGNTLKEFILEKQKQLSETGWNIDIRPLELFEPVKQIIIMEHKNDSFKRFIRTKACLKLVEKYQDVKGVLLPQVSKVFSYKDEDFQNIPLTDQDKEFMKIMQLDNTDWKIAYSDKKNKVTGFISYWNFFPELTFLSQNTLNAKVEIIFNSSLQRVALTCLSNYLYIDPMVINHKVLEYKPGEYVKIQFTINLGFMMGPTRIETVYYSISYDPEKKKIFLRTKPCQMEDWKFLQEKKTKISKRTGKESTSKTIQFFTWNQMIITEIDENKTLYEYIFMLDLGGKTKIPKVLITKMRASSEFAAYSKKMKGIPKEAKLEDYKYEMNKLWEGLPVDPLGKLLMDLDIDGMDKAYKEKIEKRKQVFVSSNFLIHFNCLKRKEIAEKYFEFLKLEFNSDSWEFIMNVDEMKKLHEKSKFEEEKLKAKKIADEYFREDSPKYLSIDEGWIEDLIKNLENPIENYPMFKYFQKIYESIKLEHQMDSFKRFGKSEMAKEVLSKYQHDSEVMTPLLGILSNYIDEDFTKKKFSEQDFKFCSSILSHSYTW
jgi:hypothetical protein